MIHEIVSKLGAGRLYDLAQPWFTGMPHHPSHPAFLFSLNKKHGDYLTAGGTSSASEAIALGGHVGTHIDALCHFSRQGRLHDGAEAAGVQSYGAGIERLSVDSMAPLIRRGVLLDIAGARGVDALDADASIGPEELDRVSRTEGVQPAKGDVVLLRTGWARFWDDPRRFVNEVRGPGPALEGARWLSEHGVVAAGSDTVAFELVPAPEMPVHVHLLVESGIHIIENLNLEALARDRVYEFLFVASPLKIRGGTGSPIRPFGIALG